LEVLGCFLEFLEMVASGRSQLLIPGFRHAHTLHQPKSIDTDVYSSVDIVIIVSSLSRSYLYLFCFLVLLLVFLNTLPGVSVRKTLLGEL